MIDCSKTENYLAEKLRMTKKTKKGLCKTKCSDCPLGSDNNGEGLSCLIFELYFTKKAIEAIQKWRRTPTEDLFERVLGTLSECRA